MAFGKKRPLYIMRKKADEICVALHPYFERLEVAGSIRRQRQGCTDIELVGIPIREASLLETEAQPPIINRYFDALRDAGLAKRKGGNKYIQFVTEEEEISVDLFMAHPGNFGYIYMLRTGNRNFSAKMVTNYPYGYKPISLAVQDGWVYRITTGGRVKLDVPDEETLFNFWGMEPVLPISRNPV